MRLRAKVFLTFSLILIVITIQLTLVSYFNLTLSKAINNIFSITQARYLITDLIHDIHAIYENSKRVNANNPKKIYELLSLYSDNLEKNTTTLLELDKSHPVLGKYRMSIEDGLDNIKQEWGDLENLFQAGDVYNPDDIELYNIEINTLENVLGQTNVQLKEHYSLAIAKEKKIHNLPLKGSLIIGFVSLLTVTILAFIFANSLVNPIMQLLATVKVISDKKDYTVRAKIKAQSELGQLVSGFNEMVEQIHKRDGELRKHRDTLEEEVSERTLQLTQVNRELKDRTIELEEAGIKTQAIIENMVDGLVAVDTNQEIFLANRTFESMIGTTDLIGKNINSVLGDFARLSQTSINDKEIVSQEEIVLKDRFLKMTSSLIKHDDAILGVVMLLRDITVEKEIDRMKTDFISNVSHELRTPLTSVLGFASNAVKFYRKDIKPVLPADNKKVLRRSKTIEENLTIIISEGERLTRLINDVLDISKMEQGKIDWNLQNVNIVDICRQALNAVAGYPKSENVKILFEAPDNVQPIRGDQDRLIQVIANFMSNALKVTTNGSITLKVEALKDHAKVSVTDTGPGVEEHNLRTIFEKFKQVGDILTNKAKGTGLGLPICKQIIEQLGGSINVESQVGVGSCFYFTLGYSTKMKLEPSLGPVVNKKRTIVEEIIQKITPSSEGAKPNILVIDDDAKIRKMLRQELEDEGYCVWECKNGTEALMFLKNEHSHIDLVLLDIMMPQVDGFDVLSAIKTNENLAHIPIIVVSAYSDKSKVYRLGADNFVTKPIDNNKLNSIISSLLNEPIEKKVLIIEKDGSIGGLIKLAMEDKGYTVVVAVGEKEGFERALAEKPDMMMIDLDLTEIQDGLELIRKLRTNEATSNIHIVLIADDMNENDRKLAECLNLDVGPAGPLT